MAFTVQDRESVIKLKLIGSLQIGDKIDTHYMAIMPDTLGTKLNRWIYGETRLGTVTFCRNSISQAIVIHGKTTDQKMKEIIYDDLQSARAGLICLQETYIADVRVHSELLEIIQNIP